MTTEAFVTMIWKQLEKEEGAQPSSCQLLSLSDYGHRRGWLEHVDITGWKNPLERRTAARIVHEILRKERHEADEDNWRGAEQLKDLYDCHTCVNHVAQVYAKGIMEPVDGNNLFGMRQELTREEAERIVMRIFCREKRKLPTETNNRNREAKRLSREEALKYLAEEEQAVLIDVRAFREYQESHLPGAISIPMADFIKSADILCNTKTAKNAEITEKSNNNRNNTDDIIRDKMKPVYFYCNQGYQSEIAANCASEAGVEKAYYFSLFAEQT